MILQYFRKYCSTAANNKMNEGWILFSCFIFRTLALCASFINVTLLIRYLLGSEPSLMLLVACQQVTITKAYRGHTQIKQNKHQLIYCSSIPCNLLYLADRLIGIVLHSHQQSSRVQNSVVVRSIEGFNPGVSSVIRHVHIRPHHRDGITNTPW